MEQYPVPQFIEEEAKMTSFLTVKQFVYIVISTAILFILYTLLPFFLFVITSIFVVIVAVALGFFKLDGVPVLTIILNSVGFITGTKNYTWRKKESLYPFKTIHKAEIRKIDEDKTLKIGQKSGLKKLRTKVELRIK